MNKDAITTPAARYMLESSANNIIAIMKEVGMPTDNISDGFHTFGQLYSMRAALTAALFNEWNWQNNRWQVHKSRRHYDGEECFGGGWFIVCAMLPGGKQISFHYPDHLWENFVIPETETALWEFDGHTDQDVINQLNKLRPSIANL